ncbi:hypothetical protein TRFO_03309 [Tritrichomonas foetus]|uniref:Raptor N-terminal CASPase-like domain-containing protein n=1 Tax=Tritrichomonas foetus TaxID=1144522 RepID=A0A1J4KRK5_9EUKA|nr:hypothetical protein TRFO_03309 [Tritrichomonas foetus]|eukprot:OHT13560.1 hypothetical protein TRFO_03309 [Tritrichomonas foetus]
MLGMKKSAHLDLHALAGSNDSEEDYSDSFFDTNDSSENSDTDNSNDFPESKNFSASLEKQAIQFSVRDFPNTKNSKFPPLDDSDFDLSSLNTPLLPQNERQLQPVDCVFLMVASPNHFPQTDSDYLRGKPLIYMWKDLTNVLASAFSQCIQTYFREYYTLIRPRLRFYFQIDPTTEKLNNVNTIRRDIQGGRILFHYIGFGFPKIDESYIYSVDQKNGGLVNYPIRALFENLKAPAWFIFDCSNAAAALSTLEKTAAFKSTSEQSHINSDPYMNRAIDWKDWFCLCATDVNEELPIDPHLPRDFLTSCLLTPVTMAIVCHTIQYYRTTIVSDSFPLDQLKSPLIAEDSPIHSALQQTLSAITDAIAADSLSPEIYRLLFRKDRVTMVIFQRFLLAQYLLRPFQVHPKSMPALPDLSIHPLWQHWRTIVDMTVSSVLTPHPSFATDLFVRAKDSVRGFLERKEENLISPAHLMLLFHVPENAPYRNDAFVLLASYAATSTAARNLLTRTALFNSVFAALVSNENFDPKVFHALCYLTISLLQSSPRFVNDIRREFDVSSFPQRLFDENLPMYTRTLVAAIIAAVLPHSEGIRSVAVSPSFLVSMQKLLATSDAPLSLWSLIIQRRMFDSFGSELKNFFAISMHIQVASFALHSSPEVRAASLATIPCFLQQNSDTSNAQLFGLTMFCAFDASFLVRFNFVLFLSRFLTIYQDKIAGKSPIGTLSHQCFRSLAALWIGDEKPFEGLISDFSLISSVVDAICRAPDFLSKFVQIGLLLVDQLADDPHPSVKAAAQELRNFVQMQSGFKQRIQITTNLSAPSRIDHELNQQASSFPTHNVPLFDDFESSEERPALCESGGDAMYKVCVRQVVAAGCSLDSCTECDDKPVISALPVPPVSQMPSTKLVLKSKTKFELGKPTVCAYHDSSLSLAVGTITGNVVYQSENLQNTFTHSFGERVTSLCVADWDTELVLVGTEDGCAYVWEPQRNTPRLCFRADSPARCGPMPLVIAPQFPNKLLAARGNCGTVRMWDIRTQRIAGEWDAGANQAVTALAVHPSDPNVCVAGFLNGLLVTIDVRCSMSSGPTNVDAPRANEKILRIVGNTMKPHSFWAGTSKGSCMRWETLNNLQIVKEGQPLADFDVHKTSPLAALSLQNAPPVITDFEMKVIHTLKYVEHGSACAFHPALPVVVFAGPSGEVVQYELTTNK